MSALLREASNSAPSQLRDQGPADAMAGLIKDVSRTAELPGTEGIVDDLLKRTVEFYSHGHDRRKLYAALGIRPSSGILLQGSSGSGKTSLAYLLGKRAAGRFKFLAVSCAELVHKVVGETERKLSQIFKSGKYS